MFRVAMLVGTIALPLLAACIQVAPTPEPPGPPTPVTPITREQAIQIVLGEVSMSWPDAATALENPRNPVARLMTEAEWAQLRGAVGALHPDRLVWVVQFQGISYSQGIGESIGAVPRTQYNYAIFAIDAQTGMSIGGDWRYTPMLQNGS
jgi:hypothetical protein